MNEVIRKFLELKSVAICQLGDEIQERVVQLVEGLITLEECEADITQKMAKIREIYNANSALELRKGK